MTARPRIPACFIRGGSSKGVFFAKEDLPDDRATWDPLFLSVLGSPDPYGRQLNGMGGGISSLSKAAVISTSERPDADLDFTFAQVAVGEALVDYSSNCGNLSSAVAPFAIERGLISVPDGMQQVRIYNTNTKKRLIAHLNVKNGLAEEQGTFSIPGVAGTGAPIRLEFLEPGGAGTGKLMPTGNPQDTITLGDGRSVQASLIDAGNPCVFLDATALGKSGNEGISGIEGDAGLMALLEEVRRKSGVMMGLGASEEQVPAAVPKVAIVGIPGPATDLAGNPIDPDAADLAVRMLSMENLHRVLPLTGAMSAAVACRIPGTIPAALVRDSGSDLHLTTPSGILPLNAKVETGCGSAVARSVTVIRTARVLMTGEVPAFSA